jgi:hypothetical protein
MGIMQNTQNGGMVMTSVLLPRSIVDEVKKKGLTYRGLIVRGLEKLDNTTLGDVVNENKRLQENISKYQIRLSDLNQEIQILKRRMDKDDNMLCV